MEGWGAGHEKGQKKTNPNFILVQITPSRVANPTDPKTVTKSFVTIPAEVVLEIPHNPGTGLPTEIRAICHREFAQRYSVSVPLLQ